MTQQFRLDQRAARFKSLIDALKNTFDLGVLRSHAKVHSAYFGKKPLGYDFEITEAGLIGTAHEFGTKAMHKFFDGEVYSVQGRSVVDAMKEYGELKILPGNPIKTERKNESI